MRYVEVPMEALTVEGFGRKEVISALIIDIQDCWENLELIKERVMWNFIILDEIKRSNKAKDLKEWRKLLKMNEMEIKKLLRVRCRS